ncbi:DUF5009 domain-containing protein [Solimicrobium silvestre]|uniref:DUF5009 domain-containing protein n=1 Tax=Solimicrobium silvestre TaxID=2099400 RepID=A0A2S9GUA7_9BURK|nr:DUF5009 domain-containing protein [Solimicrobium silvestre]PRC91291.1 hypothetical protein S2091_3962 [Solimicrobium silvestre]
MLSANFEESSIATVAAPVRAITKSIQRIRSIDAFRGLTIFIMIFVNELAGVKGVPAWMEHMPATIDGMTFVDVVFPAFLFIVGMSIPFAIAHRRAKGDNFIQLQRHVLARTLGLLVLGVFMVNAEDGYNQAAMPLSINLWSLLFYFAAFLVWHVRLTKSNRLDWTLRLFGVIGLLALALVFRGGDGTAYLAPQWWGILGLIGWAYLIATLCFQLSGGEKLPLVLMLISCVLYYCVGHSFVMQHSVLLPVLFSQGGNAAHASIVLCGVITAQIFFQSHEENSNRWVQASVLAGSLALFAALLRPDWHISKIAATPSWCLYSAAICIALFMLLHYLVEVKQQPVGRFLCRFVEPAANSPLLTYLLPFVVYQLMQICSVSLPDFLRKGSAGIAWSACYALLIMLAAKGLNRLNLRLQL